MPLARRGSISGLELRTSGLEEDEEEGDGLPCGVRLLRVAIYVIRHRVTTPDTPRDVAPRGDDAPAASLLGGVCRSSTNELRRERDRSTDRSIAERSGSRAADTPSISGPRAAPPPDEPEASNRRPPFLFFLVDCCRRRWPSLLCRQPRSASIPDATQDAESSHCGPQSLPALRFCRFPKSRQRDTVAPGPR
ncbi:hypothetical protein MTO96_014286 [Rhipicephalus appendiculatus]